MRDAEPLPTPETAAELAAKLPNYRTLWVEHVKNTLGASEDVPSWMGYIKTDFHDFLLIDWREVYGIKFELARNAKPRLHVLISGQATPISVPLGSLEEFFEIETYWRRARVLK